jgi:hypothetical protein
MMVSMIGRPPKGAALSRRRAQNGEDELGRPRSFECPVRKIPVIDPGDTEHPDQIERNSGANRGPAPADDKDGQAAQMQNNKRQAADPIDAIKIADLSGDSCGVIVGIEPLDEKGF